MPKSGEKKWKQRLGKPLNIAYSVWERKLLRASSAPSPPSSSFCPSTLGLHCSRRSLKSKHQHVQAGGVASALSSQGGGWWHRINLTHLQSSQWSPRPPCSSWQPDLCGQICWHSGMTCRRQFPLPSGSSFWGGAGPGWWSSVAEWGGKEHQKKQCSVSLSSFSVFRHTQHYNVGDQWQFTPSPTSRGKRRHRAVCVGVCAFVKGNAAYFLAQGAQVALEIPTGHQLHNHQGWLSLRDHTQQPHLHQSQWSRGHIHIEIIVGSTLVTHFGYIAI